MPAEAKAKSTIRKAPYDVHRRTQFVVPKSTSSNSPNVAAEADRSPPNDRDSQPFLQRLSVYLKSKNEAYRKELGKMEDLLIKAEENSVVLKETVTALGNSVDALEKTVSAAAQILSSSLMCTVCFDFCLTPTSLKCGHAFCRVCLQSWFLKTFEQKCEESKINLGGNRYSYIYKPSSTLGEPGQNMARFAKLSNSVRPHYRCPVCRDPLIPSIRNSFPDFKLTASINTLQELIGYEPAPCAAPDWKLSNVDFLEFLNSEYFRLETETGPGGSNYSVGVNDAAMEDLEDIVIDATDY